MKPCSRNRKLIAWLALEALDAQKTAALHDHLAGCEGCRRYWEEISRVAGALASARPDSGPEASESFDHMVAERLHAAESGSVLEHLATWLRGPRPSWRVALPALAALVIALIVMLAPRHHPVASPTAPPAVRVASASGVERDLAPTIANYEVIANQSLEKLSDLLTRQGIKPLAPAPVYTISSLDRADAPF